MEAEIAQSQLLPGRFTFWSRIPFAFTAIAGGAVLSLLKYYGWHQAWVTGAAVLIILAYAATVHFVPKLRLREDQLADNCYYLGFLFTLFSLSWALWDFSKNGDENVIVANFGLALGSTIVGILLRVTINQARKDIIETEADARMELAQSVVRLRIKIDDAVLALSSFHKQTEQIASDAIHAAATRAAEALDTSITKVGVSSTNVLDRIDSAFAEFTEHAQQLNQASAGTVKALKALLTRIEKIEAPNDIVLKRLEPALDAVTDATDHLRVRLENGDKLLTAAEGKTRAISERLEQAVDAFARTQNSMSLVSDKAALVLKTVEQTNEQFNALAASAQAAVALQKELTKAATEHGDGINKAAQEQLQAIATTFSNYNGTLAIELERCRRMVAGTGTALAELAESLGHRIDVAAVGPAAE